MIRLLFVTVFLLCTPLVTSAQATEDFTVRVFGAVDIEAPSSPIIQSVVPVAFSQIDITWATSTDNFLVFGYVVSRDGVPIATTTEPFYSDTGLAASTTYSYSVQAFDGVPNYSSSSLAVATTTPIVPVIVVATTTSAGSQTSTAVRAVLDTISVDVQATAADIEVVTKLPARIEIRLGETSSYEIGYVTGIRYAREHVIPLSDLRPGTQYFFEVYGYTPTGNQTLLHRGSFTTLSAVATIDPANVAEFNAMIRGQSVDLSWVIPESFPSDARVRIARSHYGYPTFINDGVVVYEGINTQATDQGVLSQYNRVYYTAFVIDPNGRVSSGAIAQVIVSQSVGTETGPTVPADSESEPGGPESEGVWQEVINLDMPDPSEIIISQLSELFTMADDTIPLSSNVQFTVSVPSQAIVGEFKTIIATLADPRGSHKTFSFLLRLNSDRTSYQATIAAVQVSGAADFTLEIYDYDSLVVGRYTTQIVFIPEVVVASSTLEVLWWRLVTAAWYGVVLVPLVVLGLLWFIYYRREREEAVR